MPLAVLSLVLAAGGDDGQRPWADGAAAAPPASVLYVDPDSPVVRWLTEHSGDDRAPLLWDRLAAHPTARWYTDPDPAVAGADVRRHVSAATVAGAVPVLVLYTLPDRDCGGASAGGAANWADYAAWIDAVAAGLGKAEAIVLLEPDSLALQTCLADPGARDARHDALSAAVETLKDASPRARVYLDGGHSAWHPPRAQAELLRSAGVGRADGFATNVSSYRSTADELVYGRRLRAELGDGVEQVIDTGRNGAGPLGVEWCDPPGRRLGPEPTMTTDEPGVAAFLWVKPPGEADGCAAAAGTFLPERATELVRPVTRARAPDLGSAAGR